MLLITFSLCTLWLWSTLLKSYFKFAKKTNSAFVCEFLEKVCFRLIGSFGAWQQHMVLHRGLNIREERIQKLYKISFSKLVCITCGNLTLFLFCAFQNTITKQFIKDGQGNHAKIIYRPRFVLLVSVVHTFENKRLTKFIWLCTKPQWIKWQTAL